MLYIAIVKNRWRNARKTLNVSGTLQCELLYCQLLICGNEVYELRWIDIISCFPFLFLFKCLAQPNEKYSKLILWHSYKQLHTVLYILPASCCFTSKGVWRLHRRRFLTLFYCTKVLYDSALWCNGSKVPHFLKLITSVLFFFFQQFYVVL